MPCVFVAMLGMTTHSENLMRVQQELWYLINDEDVKQVLEAMIEKMKEVGDSSEPIKQWREEARAYILTDNEYKERYLVSAPKYDENYWVAAYILYTNIENFKDLFDRLDNINSELSELEDEIEELQHEQEDLEDRIEDLRYELESLLEQDEDDKEDDEEWEEDDEDEEDEDEEEDEEIADLRYQIEQLEEELEDVKERYEEASDRFCDLEYDKKHLLWEIMERAEQLVAS